MTQSLTSPEPEATPNACTLDVAGLHSFYGPSHVLQGISLRVQTGKLVALLGRNGAGKTTTLRSIMSIIAPRAGTVLFKGRNITGMPTFQIARLGIGYIPEERRIFSGLTVMDNLRLAMLPHKGLNRSAALDEVFGLFPVLKNRVRQNARSMSGGEQQMLALARALLGSPQLLLVDEPTQGLAPSFVTTILDVLKRIRDRGVSILLVEQNAIVALDIADSAYVIDQGRIRFSGSALEIREDKEIQHTYLSL